MKTARYEAFNSFYEENADKLLMLAGDTYPIDYTRANEWVERQCDESAREFARAVVKFTRHISFKEYHEKLIHQCGRLEQKLSAGGLGKVILIVLGENAYKSNTWVSLIVFGLLREYIDDVMTDPTDAFILAKDGGEKVFCIACDDASYSGTQLSSDLSLNITRLTQLYPGQHNIVEEMSESLFSVVLVVSYIGRNAADILNPYNFEYLIIPSDIEVIPRFADQVKDELYLPLYTQGILYKLFQYYQNVSAVYFDHKVADGLSVLQKIYEMAPIYGCNEKFTTYNFITGCEDNKLPYAADQLITDFDDNEICPRTFYKSIKYTLRGQPVDKNLPVEKILESS